MSGKQRKDAAMRCGDCNSKIGPAWAQTEEFRASHFCARCLWGEEFYNQIVKACRQSRIRVTPETGRPTPAL